MTTRSIDLSGTYIVAALTANSIQFDHPENINPNWLYADLAGDGTTGYAQNISMLVGPKEQSVDLSGTYTVTAVTATTITLDSPATVNPDWGFLSSFPDLQTRLISAWMATHDEGNWIGPFIVESPDTALLIANFVAEGGLYKDNGTKQTAFPITVQLESTPVNLDDSPRGAAQTFTTTIPGNASDKALRASTLVCELSVPGRCSVRARRTTNADYNYKGTVVDEIKWQDLYGVSSVPVSDFGNVTTVHARTYATMTALAVKDRKLNMLATRKIPTRISGSDFTAPALTLNAADIMVAVCTDPHIGGRSLGELDLDSIYDAVQQAVDYFGSAEAGRFCYTFDDESVSFEETATAIAQTVFSSAYRQGNKIRMAFEGAAEDSTLLFNHRNKMPGTEKRTVGFGTLNDSDGVELDYVAPDDDSAATIFIPANRTATKPQQVKTLGVRSHLQAYWLAWRAWNRIQYQNMTLEFTALQEAAAVIRNERVLIADNTRPDTQDGEIVGQDGLDLELSQPAAFADGDEYTIFLQLPDATIQAIPVIAGADEWHAVLATAPRIALAVGDDLYASAGYQIVKNDSPRQSAFLIVDKQGDNSFNFTLQAINYSPLYYANDQLVLWMNFLDLYNDGGPFQRDGVAAGGGALVADTVRGQSYAGAAGASVGFPAFAPPASYTKAAWIKRGNLAVAGGEILSSAHEAFDFGTNTLRAGHGAIAVEQPWPAAGSWHHAAVTFDAGTGEMTLFVDGAAVQTVTGVAAAAAAQLTAFSSIEGRASDLRLIRRPLSVAEIRALFRATRL